MEPCIKRIAIAGGFDPIHPGHIALIEEAQKYGEVHIIVHSDAWLIGKKGFFFHPWNDRKKILEAYTPHIHAVDDEDGTACEAIERLRPDYFGYGGDEQGVHVSEIETCKGMGIEMIGALGGEKYTSSSALVAKQRVATRWGWYDVVLDMPMLKVKLLHVEAGKTLSLQRHRERSEFFFMPNGEVRMQVPGVWHVLAAPAHTDLDVLEVQIGLSRETDIEKIAETDPAFAYEREKKIRLNH